jgi:hypothetical protein
MGPPLCMRFIINQNVMWPMTVLICIMYYMDRYKGLSLVKGELQLPLTLVKMCLPLDQRKN